MEEVTPLNFNTFWSKSSPQHLARAPRTFNLEVPSLWEGLIPSDISAAARDTAALMQHNTPRKKNKGYARQHTLTIPKSSSWRLLCRALSSQTTCENSSLHLPRNPPGLKGLKLFLTPSLFSLVFHYMKASSDFLRFVS